MNLNLRRALPLIAVVSATLMVGCSQPAPPPAAPQAMPVKVSAVSLTDVPTTDTYVATIKSRRTTTMQPQVDGRITRILVKSGDVVKAGQMLMQIDPLKQVATVQAQQGTEQQLKATYQYNQGEVERQRKLFEAGVTSRQSYDQAVQNFQNSQGAYEASGAQTQTQQQQLAYYQIRAPFAGVVGDVPVHLGDYVSSTTVLTTVDENADLEAYIYLPTERAAEVHIGLPIDIVDGLGAVQAHSTINFISPQVDNGLQSILAKAAIPRTVQRLRNLQLVNARVTWKTSSQPVVPVLAVVRIGGQPFVYVAVPAQHGEGFAAHQVAVTLGQTVGNAYPVLSGLKPGDKVILSSIQFLQEGAPVKPLS